MPWSRACSPCPATAPSISPPACGPLAQAGYAGWLIVEAEQDPARAHPLTYARSGYAHLRRAAGQAGFEVEPGGGIDGGTELRETGPVRTPSRTNDDNA